MHGMKDRINTLIDNVRLELLADLAKQNQTQEDSEEEMDEDQCWAFYVMFNIFV